MAHEIKHNVYLAELETALAKAKASLIENKEAAKILLDNAEATKTGSDKNQEDTSLYREHVHKYFDSLSGMNKIAPEIKLLSDQIVAMAKKAAEFEKTATTNIATAARSIVSALAAVEALNSSAASINQKAETEDKGHQISIRAAEAFEKVKALGNSAEEATMSSLKSVIASADANARYIQGYITQFSTSTIDLTKAINTTTLTAKSNLDVANQKLQDALNLCSTNNTAYAIAKLNFDSAEESNKADRYTLGEDEAKKMVKEFDKQNNTDIKK